MIDLGLITGELLWEITVFITLIWMVDLCLE